MTEEWEKEWLDMPEYIMEDTSPCRKIIVSFKAEEDVEKFAQLIGQRITKKQKSLWFPQIDKRTFADKRYVDGEDVPDAEDLTPYLKGGYIVR